MGVWGVLQVWACDAAGFTPREMETASPEPEPAAEEGVPPPGELRRQKTSVREANAAQFRSMPVKELKAQATDLGVSQEAIREAVSSASTKDARKDALARLIQQAEPGYDAADFELREELNAILERGFGALCERAQRTGWSESALEALEAQADEDDDDPGLILLDKLVKQELPGRVAKAAREKQLRAELHPMKVSTLLARAENDGVIQDQLRAALDADDIKAEVTQLILDKSASCATILPHKAVKLGDMEQDVVLRSGNLEISFQLPKLSAAQLSGAQHGDQVQLECLARPEQAFDTADALLEPPVEDAEQSSADTVDGPMLQLQPHGSTFEDPVLMSFDLASMTAGMAVGDEGVLVVLRQPGPGQPWVPLSEGESITIVNGRAIVQLRSFCNIFARFYKGAKACVHAARTQMVALKNAGKRFAAKCAKYVEEASDSEIERVGVAVGAAAKWAAGVGAAIIAGVLGCSAAPVVAVATPIVAVSAYVAQNPAGVKRHAAAIRKYFEQPDSEMIELAAVAGVEHLMWKLRKYRPKVEQELQSYGLEWCDFEILVLEVANSAVGAVIAAVVQEDDVNVSIVLQAIWGVAADHFKQLVAKVVGRKVFPTIFDEAWAQEEGEEWEAWMVVVRVEIAELHDLQAILAPVLSDDAQAMAAKVAELKQVYDEALVLITQPLPTLLLEHGETLSELERHTVGDAAVAIMRRKRSWQVWHMRQGGSPQTRPSIANLHGRRSPSGSIAEEGVLAVVLGLGSESTAAVDEDLALRQGELLAQPGPDRQEQLRQLNWGAQGKLVLTLALEAQEQFYESKLDELQREKAGLDDELQLASGQLLGKWGVEAAHITEGLRRAILNEKEKCMEGIANEQLRAQEAATLAEKARKEAAENHKELTARLADQEAKNSQLREDLGFVQEGKTADLIQELREHVEHARIDAREEAQLEHEKKNEEKDKLQAKALALKDAKLLELQQSLQTARGEVEKLRATLASIEGGEAMGTLIQSLKDKAASLKDAEKQRQQLETELAAANKHHQEWLANVEGLMAKGTPFFEASTHKQSQEEAQAAKQREHQATEKAKSQVDQATAAVGQSKIQVEQQLQDWADEALPRRVFLQECRLPSWESAFTKAGFHTVKELRRITKHDLKQMAEPRTKDLSAFFKHCGLDQWQSFFTTHLPTICTAEQLQQVTAADLEQMAKSANMKLGPKHIEQVLSTVFAPHGMLAGYGLNETTISRVLSALKNTRALPTHADLPAAIAALTAEAEMHRKDKATAKGRVDEQMEKWNKGQKVRSDSLASGLDAVIQKGEEMLQECEQAKRILNEGIKIDNHRSKLETELLKVLAHAGMVEWAPLIKSKTAIKTPFDLKWISESDVDEVLKASDKWGRIDTKLKQLLMEACRKMTLPPISISDAATYAKMMYKNLQDEKKNIDQQRREYWTGWEAAEESKNQTEKDAAEALKNLEQYKAANASHDERLRQVEGAVKNATKALGKGDTVDAIAKFSKSLESALMLGHEGLWNSAHSGLEMCYELLAVQAEEEVKAAKDALSDLPSVSQ
eukprot:COSAG03_NODE_256_length_9839_cov_4.859754_5_plen_1545_part_00